MERRHQTVAIGEGSLDLPDVRPTLPRTVRRCTSGELCQPLDGEGSIDVNSDSLDMIERRAGQGERSCAAGGPVADRNAGVGPDFSGRARNRPRDRLRRATYPRAASRSVESA